MILKKQQCCLGFWHFKHLQMENNSKHIFQYCAGSCTCSFTPCCVTAWADLYYKKAGFYDEAVTVSMVTPADSRVITNPCKLCFNIIFDTISFFCFVKLSLITSA